MPARDVMGWAVFEAEYGPLTMGERLDHVAALISYAIHAAAGGQGKLTDFMPQWRARRKVDITDWLSAIATKEQP